MKSKSTLRSFLVLASSTLVAISYVHAASTWNAGTAVSTDGLWATATNWSADTAPADGADLIFDGAANPTNSNNIPLTGIGSLTLNNAGWNITLGTVTLTNGIAATGNATVGGTLTLAAPQAWSNTTGLLTVTGTVANGSNLLTVGGAGNTTISAILGSGAGGVTKSDSGTLTLTGANTFSGQLTIQNGTLTIFAANDAGTNGRLGNSLLPVILGNTGTQTGTLQYTGSTGTSNKPFTMAAGGIGAFNITTAATALTLSGIIDGGGALSKTGPGTLTLSNTGNTYGGGTILNAGTLFIASNGNLGDAAGGLTFTGNSSLQSSATFTTARLITVNSTVTATLIPTNTWTNSGKVTGAGGLAFNSAAGNGPHASLLTNTGNDFTGAISVDGNAGGQSCSATFNSLVDSLSPGTGNISIGSNSSGVSAGASVVFNYGSGAIVPLTLNNRQIRLIGNGSNNNGTGATFSNQNTTQAVTITTDLLAAGGNGKLTLSAAAGPTNVFSGLIANGSANSAGVIINKTGAGTWAFSGANTYTGSTLVAAGTLTVNSISDPGLASPIGASSGISLSLTGGTLRYAPINAAGAAGHSTTRNFGLVASSTIDASGTGALVFNAPTDGIVSPDSSGVSFTSSGRTISGLASTAKLAAGMKFTGTGVAANSTIVSIDTATQVTLNNPVTTGGSAINGAFGYGARTLTLTGTNTANNTIGGNLVNSSATGAGALSLTKSGAGTWLLTGTNTYTGATTVSAGTLTLGVDDCLSDSSNVVIGNGTLSAAANVNDTVGTLSVTNAASTINLGAGATLAFATGSPAWTGTLNITGTFVSGSSLRFGTTSTGLTVTQLGQITGVGTVTLNGSGFLITAGGNTFADWLALNPPATGFVTDSDNDGLSNGVENVLGSNPNTYNAGLTEVSATPTSVVFKHTLNPTIASDVTYSYEWSTDLVEWKADGQTNTGNTTATILASPPALGVVTVTITITGGPSAKLFGRLVAVK